MEHGQERLVGKRGYFMKHGRMAVFEKGLKLVHFGSGWQLEQAEPEGLYAGRAITIVHGISSRHFDPLCA